MFPESSIPELAHVIQLAVAPVFLLTALSTMLSVLINRLSRVVDRTRKLEAFILDNPARSAHPRTELHTLFRRTVLCNRAINLCTLTALLILRGDRPAVYQRADGLQRYLRGGGVVRGQHGHLYRGPAEFPAGDPRGLKRPGKLCQADSRPDQYHSETLKPASA